MAPTIEAITGEGTRGNRCYQISNDTGASFIWPDEDGGILPRRDLQRIIAEKLGLKDIEELQTQLDSGIKFNF